MEIVILGLIFNFIGSAILVLVTLFGKWHQIKYDNPWTKRYWWMGWRPIFKVRPPNEKPRWMVKWNHVVIVEGFIPPKHFWNSVGFLFIAVGFLLQLIGLNSV